MPFTQIDYLVAGAPAALRLVHGRVGVLEKLAREMVAHNVRGHSSIVVSLFHDVEEGVTSEIGRESDAA